VSDTFDNRQCIDRNVLVTGGAGFIGSHVVERLLAEGARVAIVDDFSTGSEQNLAAVAGRVVIVRADLGEALRDGRVRVADYDAIVHLAANPYVPWSVENPGRDFQLNLRNTFELLEALRKSGRDTLLVNASSAAVYGDPVTTPIRETDPTVPISPYGASKLAAENYVSVYSRNYGLRAVSLRLFSVYGPRQRKQVVYDLFRKCRENPDAIEVFGDGSQERDFVYVTNVAEAVVTVMRAAPARGEMYNLASGVTHSLTALVDGVIAASGTRPRVHYTGQVRPGDAERWSADIGRLSALGFRAAVSLEQGLSAVCAWYDEARASGRATASVLPCPTAATEVDARS
jgi:UDP-glucose 4-epimerase